MQHDQLKHLDVSHLSLSQLHEASPDQLKQLFTAIASRLMEQAVMQNFAEVIRRILMNVSHHERPFDHNKLENFAMSMPFLISNVSFVHVHGAVRLHKVGRRHDLFARAYMRGRKPRGLFTTLQCWALQASANFWLTLGLLPL